MSVRELASPKDAIELLSRRSRRLRYLRGCGRARGGKDLRFEMLESRRLLTGSVMPTIDALPDMHLQEDAVLQTIQLTGIGAGEGQPESIRVTASSEHEALVSHPTVSYQPGQAFGMLELQPSVDQSGMAMIVVTVEDAGADNDFETLADNGTTTESFVVHVLSVNDPPTIMQPASVAFAINAVPPFVPSGPVVTGRDFGESHSGSVFTSAIDLNPDGTMMIVGASGGTASEWGYVEVYGRQDELSPWMQVGQQLVGNEETVLGRAVSLSDDGMRIAVSLGRGISVMQYEAAAASWIPMGTAVMEDGVVASVDLDSSGELLAIATADSDGLPRARLYRFDGVAWQLEPGELRMGEDIHEHIVDQVVQTHVALDPAGTHLLYSIVGCGCSGAGYVQAFAHDTDSDQWLPLGSRIEGAGSYGSALGMSADGLTIAVGAPLVGSDTNMFGNGRVEVFRFDVPSGQWSARGAAMTGVANGQRLGSSVSLDADANIMLIGSPGASTDAVNKAGLISVFEFDDQAAEWQLAQEYYGDDPNASFGWRTALSSAGTSMITGTRGGSASPNKNGSLVSFSRAHQIHIDGISAGGGESQIIQVTAVSDQPLVVSNPIVNYVPSESQATLLFKPVSSQAGVVEIQVTVEDEGVDGDFETQNDNGITSRVFTFGVGQSTFAESSGRLSLRLGTAGRELRIEKNAEGTIFDLDGDVWFGVPLTGVLGAESNRMVLPDIDEFDRVELVVDREQPVVFSDSPDWRLATPMIDGQRFLRTIARQDDPSHLIYLEGGAVWQNLLEPSDINGSGQITPVDALQIINELAAHNYSDILTGLLANPFQLSEWPGRNFDQDGNGRISALDALRVINRLAFLNENGSAEGEQVGVNVHAGEANPSHGSTQNREMPMRWRDDRAGMLVGDVVGRVDVVRQWTPVANQRMSEVTLVSGILEASTPTEENVVTAAAVDHVIRYWFE